MLGQPQLHLEIRDLLQYFRLDEMPRQSADVVRDDCMAVELPVAVGQQSRNGAIDLRPERRLVRRQLTAALAPPARRASPEQLLPALGALLHFEPLARQRRPRLLERRHDPLPPRLALPRRPVHRLVEAPVVLAPPVAEEVFVRALADLDDGGAAVFDELREEVQR